MRNTGRPRRQLESDYARYEAELARNARESNRRYLPCPPNLSGRPELNPLIPRPQPAPPAPAPTPPPENQPLNVSQNVPPNIIYRAGNPSPSNLKPRPGEDALSFRDSLSNPWPLQPGQRPVFRPGDSYFGINAGKLPCVSVIPDNIPPGHVGVRGVTPQQLQQAVTERGSFAK